MSIVLASLGLCVGYGPIPVVRDLDIEVRSGEVVALLGPNGAGKTTALLGLAGALRSSAGEVRWNGVPTSAPLHRRCRAGLGVVLDDRSVVMGLTVRENLRVGRCDPALALAWFPELEEHLDRTVGLLSGGQQQMLTLGRALARKPSALLVDELSMGLAPQAVVRLLAAVRAAADEGLAVLLVEQHVRTALDVADRVYLMRHGRVEWVGTAGQARADRARVEATYLGHPPTPREG
jgi:ABC-type branched-subunit amino acid transport system ATPase component